MDPDLVRQQEEAERVASGAAPKPATEASPTPAVTAVVEASAEPEAPAAPEFAPGRRPPLPPHFHSEAKPTEEAPAVAPAVPVEVAAVTPVAEVPEVATAPVAEAPAVLNFAPGRKPPLPPHWESKASEAPLQKAPESRTTGNPNRRALPPLGRKKAEGEVVKKKGFFRGWVKFIVLTLIGGLIGAGVGFGVFQYLHLAQDQQTITLAYGGGAGALLLGLWALLHFDV